MLSAIVCTDLQQGIGKEGKFLFHISKHEKMFSQLTDGGVLIYGANTLAALPEGKPLPNRENIIVSQEMKHIPGATVVPTVTEAIQSAEKLDLTGQHIFVIGGSTIFIQLLPQINRVYMTKVYQTVDADAFFPELSDKEWGITQRSENYYDEKANLGFCFLTYERREHLNDLSMKENRKPSILEDRCRQWLQNKWIMAESIRWVPNVTSFFGVFKKELNRYLRDIECSTLYRDLLKKYFAPDRFKLSDKYPFEKTNERCSSIFNILMLDIDFGTTGVVIRSMYHKDPFMNIRFMVRELPILGENQSIKGIYDISGYFDGFEDKALLEQVMEQAAKKTFAERYLEAPESFREAYPICPRCGATLEALPFDGRYDYECHQCEWESSLSGCTESDLAFDFAKSAAKIFQKVKREQNLLRKTEAEVATISDSVDRLVKLYRNTHYEKLFVSTRKELIDMIEKKMQAPSDAKK